MMLRLLVPRSLRTRLVLLTLGTILLVLAGTLASATYYRNKFTETVTADIVATTIRTLRAALAEIPPDERAGFVRLASQNEWYVLSRTLPSEAQLERKPPPGSGKRRHPPAPPPSDLRRELWHLVQALNVRLEDTARVGLSRGPAPRLFISLPTDQPDEGAPIQREWLVIPLDRLAPPLSTPVIAVWVAGMGLILLIAAAFSWHITRPLTRLARAADQLAAGQPQRVEPSGPTETRILGERFNAMLDALHESDTVRRTLLAGLPHDLKGPLSRMWLRIEMIQNDASLQEGMRKDVQDMQRMVNQFIGFVRGTDPATYHFVPLDLGVWLEEQISAWESAGSPVSLASSPPAGLMVQADQAALARLLDNLISNALTHAAPPVQAALHADGNMAVLTVSDHGPGIDAARRAEALRPFSRLDEARTITGSVGLGLALCVAIAREHGGTLTLDTANGAGLQVTVRLPLMQAPDSA